MPVSFLVDSRRVEELAATATAFDCPEQVAPLKSAGNGLDPSRLSTTKPACPEAVDRSAFHRKPRA